VPGHADPAAQRPLDEPLLKLRRLCLALPRASERLSHGEPTWFVDGKRTFVMFSDHHHDDRLACWCAASPLAQRAHIDSQPQGYFYPPYVGHRGWLGVYLDVPVDWDELAEHVLEGYRLVAPKRALAELDARERSRP
jgi:predicted DNA-binding protein (MmcQ/YjbR family)